MSAEVFRPKFTTSQSAQEDKKEDERPKGGWASSEEGKIAPTNSKVVTIGHPIHYEDKVHEPALRPLTDRQRRMLKKS